MLSVSCPQCNAHYTMSDELYRRKGGGQAVIVTCKRCKAEIRFEAPENTQPSNDKPTHRSLPKATTDAAAKALESGNDDTGPFVALSAGFFGPGAGSAEAPAAAGATTGAAAPIAFPILPEISSTLDSSAVHAPPVGEDAKEAAAKEEAAGKETVKQDEEEEAAPESVMPLSTSEFLSDDDAKSAPANELTESETVPLVAAKPKPKPPQQNGSGTLRRLPAPPPRRMQSADEDEEEAPPSSSGTPTLTTLMGESSVSNRPKAPSKADDFLLSLSAAPEVPLGPPTIDLSPPELPTLPEAAPPSSVAPSVSTGPKKKKKKKGPTSAAAGAKSAPASIPSGPSKTSVPVAKAAPVAAEQPRSNGGMWIGIGLLAVAGVGFYIFKNQPQQQPAAQTPAEETAQAPSPTPAATATATTTATAEQPAPSDVKTAATAPNAPAAEKAPSATEKAGGEKPAVEKPAEEKPAEKPAEEKPAPAAEKPAAEATAAPAVHGPFQPDAAKAALADAAAQATSCRKGDDPTGTASVIITFAPSGRVTSATISGPPFAGTATGGCIAATMRKAKVPPFDGDKITVSKTILIQ